MDKSRKTNIELLRIISMLMVFILHFMQGTDVLKSAMPGSFNYFVANILETLSIVAVNCFVLISGYFLIKFDFKKLFRLILQVKFYAIVLPILAIVLFGATLSNKELIKAIFPIVFRQWWFFNTYLALYCLSPILNFLIFKINKIQYKRFLIILFIMFSVFNTVYPTFNSEGGHGIYNFMFLYLIGGYIKIHGTDKIGKYTYLGAYLFSSIGIVGGNLVITILTKKNSTLLYNYDSVFVIISSVSLFMYFNSIKIQSNIINKVSKLSFGTYLIHANTMSWGIIVSNVLSKIDVDSSLLGLNILLVSTIGFISCMIVEWLRQMIMNKIDNKIVETNIVTKTSYFINKFMNLENN